MSEGRPSPDDQRASGSRPRVATALDASDALSASMTASSPDVHDSQPAPSASPPAPEAAGPDHPGPDHGRLRLIAGKVIPGTRYRLTRWLGEGGMGVVYEAQHTDIERKVALKILRYDLSQKPEMVQIFRDEARAASRTGHPNIVEIYDFGELPDGRLFLCMELLDGQDLVPPTETSVRDPAEVIAILRQLCKGLGAAHKAGVVHRDVKPENIILVQKNGRDGVVKIVDFGISAMLGGRPDRRGKIAGTPHYMAPEQIRGKAFDGRLDIYAVGCVAYELLTGRTPFPGEGLDQVLVAHIDEPPPPFRQARPDLTLPPALEQVVLRCLAKKPEDRYPDMTELEAALCEAQIAAGLRTAWDDLPLPELPESRLAKLRERMPSPTRGQTRRKWVVPAVAGTLFGVASVALAVVLTREPPAVERGPIDALAEEALLAASRTAYVAPLPGDPETATAYNKVLELEGLGGPAAGLAIARAAELRHQIAGGLVTLGDKYWDIPGARPFANEYYIWARTFEPDNARAAERSGMTPGDFSRFQEKARSGGWSLGELKALGLVSALADGDDARRQSRVLAAQADVADLSISQLVDLEAGLRGAGIELPKRPAREPEPEASTGEPDTTGGGTTGDTDAATDTDATTGAPEPEPDDRPKKPIRSNRDPTKAKKLADDGAQALKEGRRADAESLFHQAIFYDNRNAKALMGLSDIYFDTGAKQKAVQFAELAVEAAPQSKTYHLKLGDAYFVVLRYRDALKHYEKALSLGEASAQGRIDKVKKLTGP